METFIHLGQHKTGTTSIQSFLLKNKAALEVQRIFIPTDFMGRKTANHYELNLVTLADQRSSPMKDAFNGSLENLKGKVENEIDLIYKLCINKNCNKVLFSNEGLSLLRHYEEYQALYNLFSKYSIKVSVVICLRAEKEFKSSWASQLKRMGLVEEKNDKNSYRYLGDDSWLFKWQDRLAVMSQIFDKLIVYKYKKISSIHSFCDALNIDLLKIDKKPDKTFQRNVTKESNNTELRKN